MIAKPFAYYLPSTEQEAFDVHAELTAKGKEVVYYGGGSEIITMASAGTRTPDAVIDLKGIPSLCSAVMEDGRIALGAMATLETIRNTGLFPLLGTTVARIADHTNQCRITLGGNLCGTIIYREAVLPLLLSDATVCLYGRNGAREESIHNAFDGRMRLEGSEFLQRIYVDAQYASMPYTHIKQTMCEKIGYPAVTLCSLFDGEKLRIALSGICEAPFRAFAMEDALQNDDIPQAERARVAAKALPMPPLSDTEGSAEYRQRILEKIVDQVWEMHMHENI